MNESECVWLVGLSWKFSLELFHFVKTSLKTYDFLDKNKNKLKYFDLKWFTKWGLKRITIVGAWEHTDGMNKIRKVKIPWLSILGCNLIMSNFVDVAPNEELPGEELATGTRKSENHLNRGIDRVLFFVLRSNWGSKSIKFDDLLGERQNKNRLLKTL